MKILGILPESHETGAALIEDGAIRSAITEERLTRVKQDSAFPHRSIAAVLHISGFAPHDLDLVAISGTSLGARKIIAHWRYTLVPLLFSIITLWKTTHNVRLVMTTIKRNWGGVYDQGRHARESRAPLAHEAFSQGRIYRSFCMYRAR